MQPNLRVLLVKKPDARLTRALHEQGYDVETVSSGTEASARVEASGCNVVVFDLDLPGNTGLRFVEEWRRDGITTPILMLTAKDDAEVKVDALNAGADALLVKPFERDELVAQIKALARRARPAADSILRIADLEIDLATRAVRRAGQSIKLTRREFSVLRFLAANRGKIVTRSMIRANLYDGQAPASSNVVDVYVYGLRTKIDADSSQPLIETFYGEGYSLRGDG